MMRIGWNSAKKKVGIGRLIDWLGLWEFCHCWNSVKIPSLRAKRSNLILLRLIKF